MKIHIANGRVVDPASGTDDRLDVYIEAGRVTGIGAAPDGFKAGRVIDAKGLVVAPGLVDLSARLREPGFEYKATLETELAAAVAGGVTSLACPPDTDPPLDEPGLVEMLRHSAKGIDLAHVHPVGALTAQLGGERLTEMVLLREAGCVAFSQADVPLADTQVLWRAMQYASNFGFPLWLRPQDAHLTRDGVAHDGDVATRLGLAGIPSFAETIAVGTALALVRDTGARVHFQRLSTARGVELLRAAKAESLPVSADISAHHAHLSEMDLGYFDPQCHVVPPFRSARDRDALREALSDGTIDALCSDHTPVDDDGKLLPFAEAEPGNTGLELLLPLALKWGAEMKLPLVNALGAVTHRPARILGTDAGRLAVGQMADLCLFDPDAMVRVSADTLKSQGHNTPYLGIELPGRVRFTLVGGRVVFEG